MPIHRAPIIPRSYRKYRLSMIALILLVTAYSGICSGECPPPNIPDGMIVDHQGPYTDGATINARCQGNGYIIGPSSMTCVFGNWAPSFFGQCSNGPQYSCPTPRAPVGARLSHQGPFGSGDTVNAICDDGGYTIGPSSMTCVMGHWAPSFFGDCTSGPRYSCQVPQPKPGLALSRQGVVKSDESVTASCTEDMKVLLGIRSMKCVLGNWAPNQFGDCVDVNQLGTVVYSDGNGLAIIKYRNGTKISDLGNGELIIQYSSGGYGIEQVKGYRGTPEGEGHTWSIQNGMIYKDGVQIPNSAFAVTVNFGFIRLIGYEALPQSSGLSLANGINGVQVQNGIVYINGIAVARRTGNGNGSVSVNNLGSSSVIFNGVSFSSNSSN